MPDKAHTHDSSLRENVIEYLFLAELMRTLWRAGHRDIEILRSDVDNAGYDLVVGCSGVLRHIQLKSSYAGAKTSEVRINVNLAQKPSGCIIWISFDPQRMDLGPFRWFGAAPGAPIPDMGDRTGRHTKGNQSGHKAERPNIRRLRKGLFTELASMDAVAQTLFGASTAMAA